MALAHRHHRAAARVGDRVDDRRLADQPESGRGVLAVGAGGRRTDGRESAGARRKRKRSEEQDPASEQDREGTRHGTTLD